jgi:4-hydroxybenzoyl-CoA thioesterase
MSAKRFSPPAGAFTRSVPIRFSHCDPAGIVYFPHYFDMFNGLVEDWYGEVLGMDYAQLIFENRYAFPIVHIECDFKIPSRMGEHLDLTLLVERTGAASLSFLIVGHLNGIERWRARIVTAMISLTTRKPMQLPPALRERSVAYQERTAHA